jgi:hypothetical protein
MAGTNRLVSIVSITNDGQEVPVTGVEESIIAVLNEEMSKVAELAKQLAPDGSKKGKRASGHNGPPIRDSIRTIEGIITAGVGTISLHGAPVEYGSGLHNTNKWRSGAKKYKAGRPYLAARPNLKVVPKDGEFRVGVDTARAMAIPMPFRTPPDGRISPSEIYRRSHNKHGEAYKNSMGQPIIFSMFAMNPGQIAQPYLRKAMNRRRIGINSRLRSLVSKRLKLKYKVIRVVMEIGVPALNRTIGPNDAPLSQTYQMPVPPTTGTTP